MENLTPMMQQYMDVKNEYKDCILMYRLGDFYEMFFEDAIVASRELEITLTGKDCGLKERAPMCGVPHHAIQSYIAKLVSRGYKVAIGEQLEDPRFCKGIVKRDVIRVITPGTVIESNMLDEKKNNYIAGIFRSGISYGLAYADVSTGELYATQFIEGNNFEKLLNELSRINPAEVVMNSDMYKDTANVKQIKERTNTYIYEKTEYQESSYDVSNMDEISSLDYSKQAFYILMSYIEETQKIEMKHINEIKVYFINEFMTLDPIARRNLELNETLRDRNKKGSLLWVLDKTQTAMGGRLLRKWLEKPLLDVDTINLRLNSVKEFVKDDMLRGEIIEVLRHIYDIERLTGKIAYGTVNAREMIALKNSLSELPKLKQLMDTTSCEMLSSLTDQFDVLEDVYNLIENSIVDDPPISVKEGGIIKSTFDEEVKKLRTASTEGKNWVLGIEAKERELTGIKNLKVGFNKVFGYYIEVSKSNMNNVPDRYIRKQTLTNGERYITEELKEIEDTILGAQDKIVTLEYEVFMEIRDAIAAQIERLQHTSNIVASIDVLISFAEIASRNNYVMPEVGKFDDIDIREGRHPVVELLIPTGSFVPNDTKLDIDENRMNIITGPNMAGKSTYMRQVALITIMAQIGSFVPASYAKIGIVDRVFTRVGASDDLSTGQSTFMVEMNEVANILSNATNRSLLILDEIGRGTSTFDGLSIAWAVIEYLADKEKIGARTLFATHYHELTELEDKIDGIKNYCIAVKEKGEDIIFLRKIIRGGADESYGIHVAKLAGVPANVTKRANEILKELKSSNYQGKHKESGKNENTLGQFDLFNYKMGEIATELDKINLDELTPIDALNILSRMKSKL